VNAADAFLDSLFLLDTARHTHHKNKEQQRNNDGGVSVAEKVLLAASTMKLNVPQFVISLYSMMIPSLVWILFRK